MVDSLKNMKENKIGEENKMRKLIFVTGNKEKIAIAKMALENTQFKIEARKIYCEEIQSDKIEDIVAKSAEFALKVLHSELIKVDSGLFIEALGGFPGPYSAFVEKKLDAKLILKMMKGMDNRKAFYKESLAYCNTWEPTIIFSSYTYGHISKKSSGKYGLNFDRIFIANGDSKTMAHFIDEERIKRYSNKNWIRLVSFLVKKFKN